MTKKSFLFACIFCGLCLLGPCSTVLAEQVYTITEQELTTLEQSLAKVKQQRAALQNQFLLLKKQQEQLDKQARSLELQLTVSKERSDQMETQLKIVNESFKQYAAEEKSKRLRIKRQRNFAYILLCGVTAVAIKSHK